MGLYIIHIPLEYRETTFRLGLGVLRDRYETKIRLLHYNKSQFWLRQLAGVQVEPNGADSSHLVATSSTSWSYETSIEEI